MCVACLTIYDMLKAVDRAMRIESVQLLCKTGGKSGDYVRTGVPSPHSPSETDALRGEMVSMRGFASDAAMIRMRGT